MTNIYEQHKAAFAAVEAHTILKNGERVATIAFKYPRDGAGRLYAYVHWIGLEMVRGYASGYGYDKRSAACSNAMGKMPKAVKEFDCDQWEAWRTFVNALAVDGGNTWDRQLRESGFTVLQAV